MKVLACGSRDWTDAATIEAWLARIVAASGLRVLTLVHGAARGADSIAAGIAERLGFEIKAYPADWEQHGKAAGPIRNQAMLDAEHPDLVLAFTDALRRGDRLTGTGDCCARAVEMGIRVTVVPSGARP